MTPIENILFYLININIWLVAKIFILFALILYLIFSFMVIKEVDLMNKTLTGVFNLPLKIVAWLHFIFTLLVFTVALIFL